jgi:hypothetical protein
MDYPLHEQDLRTLFERRPKKALELVLQALAEEGNKEDAAEFLDDFVTQNYDDLIHALFTNYQSDKNTILLVIAGMLGSPQAKVSDAGAIFVSAFRREMFEYIYQTTYAQSVGLVLKSYMRSANTLHDDILQDYVGLLGPDFRRLTQDAQQELFMAAFYLEERDMGEYVSLDFLLEELSNSSQHAATKKAVLAAVSQKFVETVGTQYARITYRKLVDDVLLEPAYDTKEIAQEALFALSNIVVEKGIPHLFLEDDEVQDHVVHLMRTYGKAVCDHGLWVFMNAIKTSKHAFDNPKIRGMLEKYADLYNARSDPLSHALNDIIACMKHTPTVSTPPSPLYR